MNDLSNPKGQSKHSDLARAKKFGPISKHEDWAGAFMSLYPAKSFVYWNQSTMLRDIAQHQHLTGMVLDQAIGFEAAGFTPDDYKALVAELVRNFSGHPNNPIHRRAQLTPVGFQEVWNGERLRVWVDLVRSGVSKTEATARLLSQSQHGEQ